MIVLTKRQNDIITYLINNHQWQTIEHLAMEFFVSSKTIRNDFRNIDLFIADFDLVLVRKPNVGVKLSGNEKNLKELKKKLSIVESRFLDKSERNRLIELALILNRNVTYDFLAKLCGLSKQTVVSNMKEVEEYFERNKIQVVKTQGKGIYLNGEESVIRSTFINLLNTSYHNDVFLNVIVNNSNIKSFTGEGLSVIAKVENELNISFLEPKRVHIVLAYIYYRISEGNYIDSVINTTNKDHKKLENILSIDNKAEKDYIIDFLLHSKIRDVQEDKNDADDSEAHELASSLIESLKTIHSMDEQSRLYFVNGLTTHLKQAIYRIRHNIVIENELLNQIKISIPLIYEFTKNELNRYEKQYGLVFDESEIAYVAMYIESAYENSLKVESRPNVLLVCTFGAATSTILKTRIEQLIPDCNFIGPVSKEQAEDYIDNNDLDLIVTTNDFYFDNVTTVTVNPLLNDDDINFIKSKLSQLSYARMCKQFISAYTPFSKKTGTTYIKDLVRKEDIQIIDEVKDWKEAIEIASEPLLKKGLIEYRYVQKMIEAVVRFGTYMALVDETAFVHAGIDDGIKCNCTGILVLKKPIIFGEKNPKMIRNIVLLGVGNKEDSSLIDLVYIFEKENNLETLKSDGLTIEKILQLHN